MYEIYGTHSVEEYLAQQLDGEPMHKGDDRQVLLEVLLRRCLLRDLNRLFTVAHVGYGGAEVPKGRLQCRHVLRGDGIREGPASA